MKQESLFPKHQSLMERMEDVHGKRTLDALTDELYKLVDVIYNHPESPAMMSVYGKCTDDIMGRYKINALEFNEVFKYAEGMYQCNLDITRS